jgi:hypothetical protein
MHALGETGLDGKDITLHLGQLIDWNAPVMSRDPNNILYFGTPQIISHSWKPEIVQRSTKFYPIANRGIKIIK